MFSIDKKANITVVFLAITVMLAGAAWGASTSDQQLIMLNPNEVYLGGANCHDDEHVILGMLPECEATCDEPRPMCTKVFHVLDKPFCFCKKPLVRHPQSNRCIPLAECKSATS